MHQAILTEDLALTPSLAGQLIHTRGETADRPDRPNRTPRVTVPSVAAHPVPHQAGSPWTNAAPGYAHGGGLPLSHRHGSL